EKLPPGHLLVAEGESVRVEPYWSLEPWAVELRDEEWLGGVRGRGGAGGGGGGAVLVAGAVGGRAPRRGVAGADPGDGRRVGPAAPRRRRAAGRAAVRRHRLERRPRGDGRGGPAGADVHRRVRRRPVRRARLRPGRRRALRHGARGDRGRA